MSFKPLFDNTAKIISEQKEIFASAVLVSAVILSFLAGMFLIPGIDFGFMRMSPFALTDVLYIAVASVLIGGLVALYKYKISEVKLDKKAGFGGGLAGAVAAVCPVCQGVNVIAAGSTIASASLGFLIPYLAYIQFASLALLGFGFYSTTNSIYTGVCAPIDKKIFFKSDSLKTSVDATNEIFSFFEKNKFAAIAAIVVVVLVFFNQIYATSVFASLVGGGPTGGVVLKSGSNPLEYGPKMTLKPMPLGAGEQPTIAGYGSKVKPLPTISELQLSPSTGDLTTDLKNNVVPHGTPFYGAEAGVSFDEPVVAQKKWKTYINGIQLDALLQDRWKRIVNSFTCDYCCGSPQSPTIITRCGCAHAYAAQGMAKWFLKYYGDKYSDEEIYGEMARWYALWYPGPTVKRIIKEAGAA
ncbi:MAG TPA: hypothetical protein VI933_02425 [archaeon]|nr:hypothetical protein [archaeon]